MDLVLLERIGSVAWDRGTRAGSRVWGGARRLALTRGDFLVDGVT